MQPLKRLELSTPGLLDQCSSRWATEAVMFVWVVELTSVAIQNKYGDKKVLFEASGENWTLERWITLKSLYSNHWATEAVIFDFFYQLKLFKN